jgi:exopolysaccharide production protein ExoZ
MKNQSFLPSLQIFRAIAALMVVFHHLWREISYFFSMHSALLDKIAFAGKSGVDFFFVLSGFIICYAHFHKIGIWSASGEYLRNRIFRIYLPYLPISFLMLFSYGFLPSLSDVTRNVSVIKSVSLLPVPGMTALSVAWTLVHEMFFYMVFILFFASKRFFYIILSIWTLMIGLASIYGWGAGSYFLTFVLSVYNLELILGICSAVLVKTLLPAQRKWVIAALPVVILILYFGPVIFEGKVLLGLLFATLILLAVNSPLNRISVRNLFMILGNASYSIYLIHDPEISLAMRAFPKAGNPLYMVVIASFIFTAACFSGVIYSRMFEHRLLNKVKDLYKRQFMPQASPAV